MDFTKVGFFIYCLLVNSSFGLCFWDSSEERKNVDTTGTVNNNVVLSEPVGISDFEVEFVLWGLLALKLLELGLFAFREYRRSIKKKYIAQQARV